MKKVLSLSLLLSIAALLFTPPLLAGDAKTVTSDFKVEGMTCGGCEAGVKMKVKRLDGVEKVTASHKNGKASVTYDTAKVTTADIIAAIEDLGYTAELLESSAGTES